MVWMIGLIPLFGRGFAFAALVIRFKEPYAFTQAVNVLFAVVTGTLYNVTVLPLWVQVVAQGIPQTIVVHDMRLSIQSLDLLIGACGTIVVLLAMAVIYPVLGYSFFKQFERRQKSLATFPSTSRIVDLLREVRAVFVKDVRVYLRYPSWILSEFITLPAWFVLYP